MRVLLPVPAKMAKITYHLPESTEAKKKSYCAIQQIVPSLEAIRQSLASVFRKCPCDGLGDQYWRFSQK